VKLRRAIRFAEKAKAALRVIRAPGLAGVAELAMGDLFGRSAPRRSCYLILREEISAVAERRGRSLVAHHEIIEIRV